MKIFSKIKTGYKNCVNNVKNNYGKYLAKGAAIGALGMIAYDSHIVGKLQSDSYSKTKDAEACISKATNTLTLTHPSAINNNLKNKVFHLEQEQNWRSFINSTIGYVKGFTSSLVANVIPLGLGIFTLCASKKPLIKTGGWLLAGYGVISFLKDVMGFGQPKDLNTRFK